MDYTYSIIQFGSYMQMGVESQEKQPIEWIVFRKEPKKTWLLSRYCLDCSHYHFKNTDIDWIGCDLRAWLYEIFLSKAFTPDEQQYLLPIPLNKQELSSQAENTMQDNDPYDIVTIPEKNDILSFFQTNQARQCTTTEYAEGILRRHGVHHQNRVCSWWLRDNHLKWWKAPAMGRMGLVNMYPVTDNITLVRPMICLNKSLLIS